MIRVDTSAGHVEIWSEPEEGDVAIGRCVGTGDTLEEAKLCAIRELTTDLRQIDELGRPAPSEAAAKEGPFVQAASRHEEPVLEFFAYAHLPEPLRFVSKQFSAMALDMVNRLPANEERSVMLRKLLEAKDAAVRSHLSQRRPRS